MTTAIEKHPAQAVEQRPLDAFIERAASDPTFDVEKVRALLEMRAKEQERAAEREFNRAMGRAQSEMAPIVRDAQNEHTKSRYARLEAIDRIIRPIYSNHGFALSFNSDEGTEDSKLLIECLVMHEAGHTKVYKLRGALDTSGPGGKSNKTDIQGLGSTASYLRRYLSCMIFNVVLTNEDNDGNRSGGGLIGEREVNNIVDMMAECQMGPESQAKFLEIMKAKTVTDIRMADYGNALQMLRVKLRKVQDDLTRQRITR